MTARRRRPDDAPAHEAAGGRGADEAPGGDGGDGGDDERWLVVDGRRWRRQDPSIPAPLATELVAELMDARRAVKAAKAAGEGEAAARDRVGDAKVALGERGRPWWEPPDDEAVAERLAATVRTLARRRAPRTLCPSDAARVVGGERWRSITTTARDVARRMAADGEVEVLQRGEVLDPAAEWKGPVRIRRADVSRR